MSLNDPDSPIHLTWRRRHKIGQSGATTEDIKDAMIKAAILVDRYGERVKPLLDFLEKEYRARTGSGSELQRIQSMLKLA